MKPKSSVTQKTEKKHTVRNFFEEYHMFILAPFENKKLFQQWLRSDQETHKTYPLLNTKFIDLLEELKVVDTYYLALTGRPTYSKALNRGDAKRLGNLFREQPDLMRFFADNMEILTVLASSYTNFKNERGEHKACDESFEERHAVLPSKNKGEKRKACDESQDAPHKAPKHLHLANHGSSLFKTNRQVDSRGDLQTLSEVCRSRANTPEDSAQECESRVTFT